MPRDEIHIWYASLDQGSQALRHLEGMLSEEERSRAQGFRSGRPRSRCIASRGLLRTLLASYLDREPREIRFSYGTNGKPYLDESLDTMDLSFNVSHSNDAAMYAFARGHEIGVDLERVRPFFGMEHVVKRFFSPQEQNAFRRAAPGRRVRAFYDCWTRKEAVLKASGDGLARSLASFDVSRAGGAEWAIHDLETFEGYSAALAIRAREKKFTMICRPAGGF